MTSSTEVPVVMISNLQPRLREQHIFNFASIYGVVEKVKNLGQGRMLCQMQNPTEARRLIDALNTVTLQRNRVRAEASRHSTIRDGNGETADRAIDFTTSQFNRYKEGSSPLLPSKTIIFTVNCDCKVSDISAALKASDAPEPSDIVVDGSKGREGGSVDSTEGDKGDSEKVEDESSEPRTPPEVPEDAEGTGAVASMTEITTGTISCANTGIAAEIVMMANNATVRGIAHLELCFSS